MAEGSTHPLASGSEAQFAVISERLTGRRGRLRAYVFEVFTALAFSTLGVAYLASPNGFASHSAIGHRVYPFDYVWSVAFVAGGALIVLGVLLPQVRLRTVGLIVLGTGLLLQSIAAFSVAPQLRDAFNLLYAVACFVRAWLLVRLFLRYRGFPSIGGHGAAIG